MAKSNMLKLMTPVCAARYLHIFDANTKFNPEGTYSIDCIVDKTNPEWVTLIQEISKAYEAYYSANCQLAGKALKKCQYLPWTEKDGEIVFKAKNNATGKGSDGKEFTVTVNVVGPDGSPVVKEDLQGSLGNGTKVRVGFEVNLWSNASQGVGVTARLKMVQIVEPVWYNGMDAFKTAGGQSFKDLPKGLPLPKKDISTWNTANKPKPAGEGMLPNLAGFTPPAAKPTSAIDAAFGQLGVDLNTKPQ